MSAEWQSRRRLPQPASLSTRAQRAAHSDTVAAAGARWTTAAGVAVGETVILLTLFLHRY